MSALLVLPFGSSDVDFYYNSAKAVTAGINPYVESWPLQRNFSYPPDNISLINGMAYGPLFLRFIQVFYQLAGGNPFVFIVLWKILIFFAYLFCVWLLYPLIKQNQWAKEKDNFILFWLCQPLIIWEWLANGHFDVLWIVFLILSIFFSQKRNWFLALIFLSVSIWIKIIPIFLIPWLGIWWLNNLKKDFKIKELLSFIYGIGGGLAVTIVSWLGFWRGLSTIQPIILQSKWAADSLFSLVYYSLKPAFEILIGGNYHWYLTRIVQFSFLMLLIYFFWPMVCKLWSFIASKRNFLNQEIFVYIFLTLVLFLLIWQKSFWPWYIIWLLLFAVLAGLELDNGYLYKICRWLFAVPLAFYPIWYINWLLRGTDATPELWFNFVFTGLVVFYPLLYLFRWRQKKYN